MKVSPSLLSADFACLRPDIDMINNSEADYLHLDVMDGVFVPNISFGFPVMQAVARQCSRPLDVHLMIVNPDKWINQVRDLGAEIMNVHQEACPQLHSVVQRIHAAGMKAGVTINPATPVNTLVDIVEDVDLVLIMSVNPGFGGQKFIPHAVEKVRQLRNLIDSTVNLSTGAELAKAGADILVAGSFVFGAEDPAATIKKLKELK